MLKFKSWLMKKWNIKSNKDFWLIMLCYSLAGMTILPVKTVIFHAVGINHETPFWIVALVYIPLVPPAYFLGLLFFGKILGQFDFMWGQAKKRIELIKSRFKS